MSSIGRMASATGRATVLSCLLMVGTSGIAYAACSASGTTGVNFDCVGVSLNTGTVVNAGTNGSISSDDGNAAFVLAPGSDFTNSGNVTVSFDPGALNNTSGTSGYQRTRLYGIEGNDAGDYTVTNTSAGVVTVSNPGVGRLWGVAGSGDVTNFVLNNDGTIAVTRGTITLGTVSAISLTAHAAALANVNLDVGAAAYSEEELTSLNIFNTGILRATGQLTAAVYSRAEDTVIVNGGTIETTTTGTGFAVGAVSDSGETRDFDLTNSGTITGDLLLVNGQAQRYFAISKGLGGGVDTRLNINSQFGQLDSEIENTGTINGNFYYSNGTHSLENLAGGSIAGNIDIDQRDTVITGRTCAIGTDCGTLAAIGDKMLGNPSTDDPSLNSSSIVTGVSGSTATYALTIWGDKSFAFENAGTYTGNFTVRTAAAGTVNGYTTTGSSVTLSPHITTSGLGSSVNAPAANPSAINGTLKIWDGTNSTIASTTTIAPEIEHVVHSGEWYTVATDLFGAGVPTVDGTPLVSWAAAKNAGNALVVGATVADASTIAGISSNGAAALNGLLSGPGTNALVAALGGTIENLDDAADIAEAADALVPDASGVNLDLAFSAIETMREGLSARGDDSSDDNASDDADQPTAKGHGLWLQGLGGAELSDEASSISGGLIGGYDTQLQNGVTAGLAIGLLDAASSSGEDGDAQVATLAAMGYGTAKLGGIVISGNAGVAGQRFATGKDITIGDIDLSSSGVWNGVQAFASFEAAYPVDLANGVVLTPKAGLAAASLWQSAHSEMAGALNVDASQTTSLESTLGFEVEIPIPVLKDGMDVSLSFEAAWTHQFGNPTQFSASFAGGSSFAVTGESEDRDSLELGLGLDASSDNGLTASVGVSAELSASGFGGKAITASLTGSF